MVVGDQPDDAVPRAGAAIAGALRAGGVRARRSAVVRGGAEVFRPERRSRRGCCCTASRWSTASPARWTSPRCASRWRSRRRARRADGRHRVRAGRAGVQGVRRAVPHVDAGCVRGRADAGDGVLRHRAESGGDGAAAAGDGHVRSAAGRRMAVAGRAGVDRLDAAGRAGRDRAEQHQAADGVFLDRPYGLRADRPRGRHAEASAACWSIW